jgi:hypothetical protein
LVALLTWGLLPQSADAQALVVTTCGSLPKAYSAGSTRQATVDVNGNLCSSATSTATTAATAASALPTISAGAGAAVYESLAGALYVQPVFSSATGGGTQVDATHGLPVNIVAGSTTGVAQGAAYSAQLFTPVMGLASTNAPTATTGDLWALSISPASGGVRIDLKDSAANTNAFIVNPATIATWGLAASTQNVASPTNGGLVLGQFNTTPTTITTGNVSPLQLDSAGNLLVNVKAGGGSGGTSSSFGSSFPSTGTAIGLTTGTNMVAWSASSNYGTAPGAIAVPAVNAFVTNGTSLTVNPTTIATWGLTPVGGTTSSPTNAMLAGCQYLVSAPTYTTGDSGAVQCTINGYPIVNVSNTNANGQALAANSSPVVAPVLTAAGVAVVTGGIPVVNGASTYNTIAASQTAQAMTGGSGGATGDYLSQCTIVPATTAPGVVTILDNATAIYSYPGGGTTALTTLVPFTIPVGAVSVSGAWKVTTGANVSVVCVGKFH